MPDALGYIDANAEKLGFEPISDETMGELSIKYTENLNVLRKLLDGE